MPPKTINRKTAPGPRKGLKRRSPKQNAVRKRGQRAPVAPAVIANSIFELKLKPKPGAEVYFTLRGDNEVAHKSAEQMYKELYASYERIYEAMKGEKTVDLDAYGLGKPMSFHYMLTQLKGGLLPSGYNFNIDYDEKCGAAQQYFFTIYHHCEWPDHWQSFEIGPTILKLEKSNKALLDLFISFLKQLRGCGIYLWTGGFMGGTLDYISGQAEEYREIGEFDTAKEIEELIIDYEKGPPAKYNRLIQKAKIIKPAEMRRRAKLFKRDHDIANLIHQGSFIIEKGYELSNYRYNPSPPEEGYDIYLDLDDQCNIVWTHNDLLAEEHMNTLDAQAGEGQIQQAVFHRAITGKSGIFDFSKFIDEVRWPGELSHFFKTAHELTVKYTQKNERANGKSGKRI